MYLKTDLKSELPRILDFIRSYVRENEKVVVPVSGGLDSDVAARLCVMALGKDRVRLFVVRQEGLEERYIVNAKNLAADLDVELAIVYLGRMNRQLIEILHEAAPREAFQPNSLLDPARANCSLRTAIFSTYQDKGYLIVGNSNRTEIELGFFLPFGDNLGHFKPLAHLYKSEVKSLASLIHSRPEVIMQNPSAAFWEGETDLEDVAYWLYNKGPIPGGRVFTPEEDAIIAQIQSYLTQERIDTCLAALAENKTDQEISSETKLPLYIVEALRSTRDTAAITKNRPLMAKLERL